MHMKTYQEGYNKAQSEFLLKQKKLEKAQRKAEQEQMRAQQRAEQERLRREQQESERKEVGRLLSLVMNSREGYSQYEYNEVQKNRQFFQSLMSRYLNQMKKLCEFDKSSKVNWFKDGFLERGQRIQYGKRSLEFDEMFDQEQMKKVGNIILTNSTTRGST